MDYQRVLAFVNQKGGVGKTTTVANLGAALARSGRKVCLIDFDPQANLSEGLGIPVDELELTIYDMLLQDIPFAEVVRNIGPMLDIVPATIDLAAAEVDLLQLPARERRLAVALEQIPKSQYDYILIDCPPSLGQLTINGLTAAKEVIVPVQTHFFAYKALNKLLKTISDIQKWSNERLTLAGILCTLVDERTVLSKEVRKRLEESFPGKVFSTAIRFSIKVAESPATGSSIFDYKPNNPGAWDYQAFADELMNMEASVKEVYGV